MRHFLRSGWTWFAALLVLAGVALWPGTRGGFLFDDLPNLQTLGEFGRIDSLPAVARYATSGEADPIGRPVAVLSFLLDARDWPADPYPFKRTNILLHLLNGLLLFAALTELGRALERPRPLQAAALGAGLWMLHPLFVSTTLYVVQREAMLAATFTFLALWCWLSARRLAIEGKATLWIMALAVITCTLLATLSKANGMLLPALLLVVECRIAKGQDTPRLRSLRRWLLWLPTIALFALLLSTIPGSARGTLAHRGWTLGQRLLTEPRVLFDYLTQLWIPRPFSRGLFNDGYPVSSGLFHPWTTLPALAGLAGLAWLAWWCRDRKPTLSVAIAFYLVGQSMESGPIPLELYFEHRNYLPAGLMFWPLALWLTGSGSMPRLRNGLAIVFPLLLAGETWLAAGLWGDTDGQALIWSRRNPDSPRAQAYEAQFEAARGDMASAERRVQQGLGQHPLDIQLLVNLMGTRCSEGGLPAPELDAAVKAFATVPDPTRLSFNWIERAMPIARSGACEGYGMAEAGLLADAFMRNPETKVVPGRLSDAYHLIGEVAIAEGKPQDALVSFNAAYAAEPKLDTVLVQAAILASEHYPQQALAHLQLASVAPAKPWQQWRSMIDVHTWVMHRQGFWQQQIDELREKIVADLRHPS